MEYYWATRLASLVWQMRARQSLDGRCCLGMATSIAGWPLPSQDRRFHKNKGSPRELGVVETIGGVTAPQGNSISQGNPSW